jgi:hypothetical protein
MTGACGVLLVACSDSRKDPVTGGADARADVFVPSVDAPPPSVGDADGAPSVDAASPVPDVFVPPEDAGRAQRLADTGLYADPATETLAADVMAYRAKFELWSDGATKRRFLYVPPGTTIDTTDMGQWTFPVGTKAWKEFSRDGTRVETRLIEKRSDGWFPVAFVWNAEQTEAVATPLGEDNALGTEHDVPDQNDCRACHDGGSDFLLGVSAIQLSHDTSMLTPDERAALGTTLADLDAAGLLSAPPAASGYSPPGDETAQQALGVLHANCGHCHNPAAFAWDKSDLELRLTLPTLDAVENTPAYVSAVNVATSTTIDGAPVRIDPGFPDRSAVYVRMASRDPVLAMPTIASERVDTVGSQAVSLWISLLPP